MVSIWEQQREVEWVIAVHAASHLCYRNPRLADSQLADQVAVIGIQLPCSRPGYLWALVRRLQRHHLLETARAKVADILSRCTRHKSPRPGFAHQDEVWNATIQSGVMPPDEAVNRYAFMRSLQLPLKRRTHWACAF